MVASSGSCGDTFCFRPQQEGSAAADPMGTHSLDTEAVSVLSQTGESPSSSAAPASQLTAVSAEQTAAASAEQTAAASTEKIATVSAEQTAVVSGEQTAAASAEHTAAFSAEQTATVSAERTAAVSTEQTAAISAEQTAAERTAAVSVEQTAAISAEQSSPHYLPPTPALAPRINALNCGRGELLLTDLERVHFEQYLSAASAQRCGPFDRWRLVAVPESSSAVGRKLRRATAVRRSTSSSASGAAHPSSPSGQAVEWQRRQSIVSHQAVSLEVPNTRSTRSRNTSQSFVTEGQGPDHPRRHSSDVAEDKSANTGDATDWPRRMQRILLELCKQPVCLPFLPRVSPNEAHYAELARKVYPAIPLSLETVLERLDNGDYFRSLDVFNDVYTVFMCAFRYYEPGNQYWMMAQEACLAFAALTMREPLSNEFTPAPRGTHQAQGDWAKLSNLLNGEPWDASLKGDRGKTRGSDAARGSKALGKGRASRILDGASKVKTRSGRAGPPLQPVAGNAPVTVEERQSFQELLTQMNMDAHFQLYNIFKDRAKWVSFDTGEVELDDGATMPFVFREMVQWCREQASQGLGTSPASPHAHCDSASAAASQGSALQQPSADAANGLGPPVKKLKMSRDSDTSDSSDDISDEDF